MHYHTVFDLSEAGYKSASFPAFGLIFVALGAIMLAWHRRQPDAEKRRRNSLKALLLLLFAVLWTAVVFGSTYRQYLALLEARDAGRYGVAEGLVTGFQPMPYGGHALESFCVQGQCFRYSDYAASAGFNHTSSHGGPIREGLPVRVTYVGCTIIKLEVAR
jgi:hypothetical protein